MRLRHLAALALAALAVPAARAADLNVITAVEVKDEGATLVLSVKGSKKPSFTTFAMAEPPRFVIDFSESRFEGVPETLAVQDGVINVVKNLSYGSDATSIARVMIAFAVEVGPPDVADAGETLVVRIAKPAGAAAAAVASRREQDDAAAKTRADQEAQAKSDAARRAREDEEARARVEAELRTREAAEAQAKAEAQAQSEAQAKADAQARAEAQAKADAQARAEEQARADQEAQAKADAQARAEAQAKADAQARADEQARADAEASAAAQAKADAASREHDKAARKTREEPEAQHADAVATAIPAAPPPDEKMSEPEPEPAAKPMVRPEPQPATAAAPLAPERLGLAAPSARLREVGFKQLAGVSRVYVRTTVTPRFTIQDVGNDTIRVELENTRAERRNDLRFMDTSFFPSAVAMITPARQGSSYVLDIKLREKVPYQQKIEGDLLAIDFERPAAASSQTPAAEPGALAPAASEAAPEVEPGR